RPIPLKRGNDSSGIHPNFQLTILFATKLTGTIVPFLGTEDPGGKNLGKFQPRYTDRLSFQSNGKSWKRFFKTRSTFLPIARRCISTTHAAATSNCVMKSRH